MLWLAIPPKVEEAFRSFKYVPYSMLTHVACTRAAEGEEESVINSRGGLSAKPLVRKDERSISIVDWLSAASTAEDRTRFHHGEARADALAAHHKFVPELAWLHGWQVAVEYDILQRFLTVQNPKHDLGALDSDAVSLIVSRLLAQQISRNFPNPNHLPPTPKRSFPGEVVSSQSPRKKLRDARDARHCFRCGAQGHLPGDCKADSTSAGHPTFPLAGGDSKSWHALLGPDNKVFCFAWAKDSFCPFGGACINFHGCSICRGSSHGAKACRVRA